MSLVNVIPRLKFSYCVLLTKMYKALGNNLETCGVDAKSLHQKMQN